jgi:glycosyltransferase involved in cell wall biosynthesis
MFPTVSIVIPCYNQGQFLSEAIQSAIDQDYQRKEIIIVNDGSSDNTKEVVERFHHAIIYIEQCNRGLSSARNAALGIARGDYIAFLDSDDVMLPGSITKRVEYLDKHPDISMVCSDALYFNSSGALGLRSELFDRPRNPENFRWETVDYNATISSAMMRRSCFDKVGFFEESIRTSEDWLMFVKLSLYFNMAYIDEPLIKYRRHSNNLSKVIGLNNVGHRHAIAQLTTASYFDNYPAHFRAQLLFLRFAATWRFDTKQRSAGYFIRALKTDPAQLGFGMKVIFRGIKNALRRRFPQKEENL